MKEIGCFVISLDFELLWGAINTWFPDGYGQSHVKNVREVIRRLVTLFEKYEVKATFATVGFVMLEDKKELMNYIPKWKPSYRDKSLIPYGQFIDEMKKENEYLYFAPELVNMLQKYDNIEIGTHTFGHYYCWEDGQTLEQFEADIIMACKVAEKKGLQLESIVFPRNQVSEEYLKVCAKYGIKTYRGNPKKYFSETKNKLLAIYYRVARLLDSYINWGGSTSVPYSTIEKSKLPMNVPASRMLRPYVHALRFFEPLRLRRIKNEIIYAAKHHEVYHLWWHPHNFGADMEQNFSFLENVLECYQKCHEEFGMRAMTMRDLYHKLK